MTLLRRLIDVRPDEGPLVVRAFAALFTLIAGHTILETARDALFLGALPARRLTVVYLTLALVGLVIPAFNARFVRAFGRRNAVIFTLMLAAFGTTLWHFQSLSPALLYGLYLWSALLGTILVVQFWLFAGQLFTVAQGKRLFSGIIAGGVLGAAAGGSVAAGFLEVLPMALPGEDPVRALLLVSAGCFLITAMVLTSLPAEDAGPLLPSSPDARLSGALDVLRDYPYVARVALMVALGTAAVLTTDFLFKLVAKSEVPGAELGFFFARYNAVLNTVALVVQLGLTARLVQRLGVIAALALMPLLLAMGGASVALLGGSLLLVMLTKGVDGSLRHSLQRAATELLYLPLPAEVRDRAKSLVDATFVRGSQALTAGAILLAASLGLESARWFALAVTALSTLWLLSALSLRRRYLEVFRRELGEGDLDPRLLQLEKNLDLDSVESVMAALSSPDPVRVLAAMNLLVDAGRARLLPALILYHESEEVLLRALEVIPEWGLGDWKPHAARLTGHPAPRVRAAALRALGRACEGDLVRPGLADPSPAVRAHAAFQLAQCEGADNPLAHPAITELLDRAAELSPDDRLELRLGLLEALKNDADERWVDVLLMLGESDVPKLIEAVALAMARMPDERFIPLLIRHLGVREARASVSAALLEHGPPALAALERALDDPGTPERVRRLVPLVIASFSSQRAADALVRRLPDERDGAVRYRMLRALTRIVAANPTVRIDRQIIERELEKNLCEHLRLMALSEPIASEGPTLLARGSGMLLRGLLEDKGQQAIERGFRLFKLLFPYENVEGIFVALRSRDRRARANAQEFVQALALGSSDLVRQLLDIVSDDLAPAQRVARAVPIIGPAPASQTEALARLLDDGDDSVAALAAYHALAIGDARLAAAAQAVLNGTSADGMALNLITSRPPPPHELEAGAFAGGGDRG